MSELLSDLESCAARTVLLLADQSFSGKLVRAIAGSPNHANVQVVAAPGPEEYSWSGELTRVWSQTNHSRTCTRTVTKVRHTHTRTRTVTEVRHFSLMLLRRPLNYLFLSCHVISFSIKFILLSRITMPVNVCSFLYPLVVLPSFIADPFVPVSPFDVPANVLSRLISPVHTV